MTMNLHPFEIHIMSVSVGSDSVHVEPEGVVPWFQSERELSDFAGRQVCAKRVVTTDWLPV
jgi:hypothetical protein